MPPAPRAPATFPGNTPFGPLTNSRAITNSGPTPGYEYKLQVRAIAGSTDCNGALTRRSI